MKVGFYIQGDARRIGWIFLPYQPYLGVGRWNQHRPSWGDGRGVAPTSGPRSILKIFYIFAPTSSEEPDGAGTSHKCIDVVPRPAGGTRENRVLFCCHFNPSVQTYYFNLLSILPGSHSKFPVANSGG